MLIVDMLTLALANEPICGGKMRASGDSATIGGGGGAQTSLTVVANTTGGGLGQNLGLSGHLACEARSSRGNVAAVHGEVRQQCHSAIDGLEARARAEYTGNNKDGSSSGNLILHTMCPV